MRKALVGIGLLLGLGSLPAQLWAQSVNTFFVYANGSPRAGENPTGGVTAGEIPSPQGTAGSLSADLRDGNCPGCQFPAFALPQTFDPLGNPSDGHWKLSNGLASVEVLPEEILLVPETGFTGSPGIRLEQDTTGAQVSCSQEYNLFFFVPGPARVTRLSEFGSLELGFFQEVEDVFQGSNCPAPFNLASTLVGVQLLHIETQTLFNYQVVTFDSRGAQFNKSYWSFTNTQGKQVYGVVDSLETLGVLSLKPGEGGRRILLEIAPRLHQVIRENPFGLDSESWKWRFTGIYAGSYTNGQARIRSLLGLVGAR